jgi:hypothetical protein
MLLSSRQRLQLAIFKKNAGQSPAPRPVLPFIQVETLDRYGPPPLVPTIHPLVSHRPRNFAPTATPGNPPSFAKGRLH